MGFREALRHAASRPPLLFEPVPPPRGASPADIESHLSDLRVALADLPAVDALNVPQIIGGSYETVDALDYAGTLQATTGRETMVNKIVALEPPAALQEWTTAHRPRAGIGHVILVGGESSKERYPGPTVAQANALVRALLPPEHTIGNICIPFRRRPRGDEPDRMVDKTRAGADHFTSQIILEPVTMRRLLRDYERAARHAGIDPAPVFIGLAPVTEKRDLELLKNLGVEVPPHVERALLWDKKEMGDRSLELNLGVLRSILSALRDENIHVPVGLNVEQVSLRNWDASIELAREAQLLLEEHMWLMEDAGDTPAAAPERTATARIHG